MPPASALSFSHVDVGKRESALPLHHSDLLYFCPLCDNMIHNLNGQRFLYFSFIRRRRRFLIYKSYYGREETKYNRSEWCSGRALAFKTTGRWFDSRHPFLFFRRRHRRRVSIYNSYIGGLPPARVCLFHTST